MDAASSVFPLCLCKSVMPLGVRQVVKGCYCINLKAFVLSLTSLLHGINIHASLPEKCILSVHVQHEGTLDFARNAKHHL